MNWLNIHTSTLRSPEFIGSDPVTRATWLYVLALACEQENGGRIAGAKTWKCRQWQQSCGVTLEEVNAAAPLLRWEGEDLLVHAYPLAKEKELRAKRRAGARGGRISGAKRKQASVPAHTQEEQASLFTDGESAKHSFKQSLNGREGKGKEGERKEKGRVRARFTPLEGSEWLLEIGRKPVYAGININLELGKAAAYCEVNHRECSRKFFINWLNRAVSDARVPAGPPRAPEAGGF